MLISTRRLKWGVLCLLVLMAAMLVQPTRTWIGLVVVRQLVDPNISFQSLSFHPRSKVLVTEEFHWSRGQGPTTVGLESERAWIVGRFDTLPSGQITLPAVQFDNAILSMDDDLAIATTQEMNAIRAQAEGIPQWNEMRQEFKSLAAAEEVDKKWTSKIDDWITRSREIVAEIEAIESNMVRESNPLREETVLTEMLITVNDLMEEQQRLGSQLDGIRKLLPAESNQLEEAFEDEVADLILQIQTQVELRPTPDTAKSLMMDLAQSCWQKYVKYAAVADAVVQQLHPQHVRPDYDRDVLPSTGGSRFLKFDKLTADGVFRCNQGQVPFSLQAGHSHQQPSAESAAMPSEFHYHFAEPDTLIRVDVDPQFHQRRSSIVLRADELVADNEHSPSHKWNLGQVAARLTHGGQSFVRFELQAAEEEIDGELQFAPTRPGPDTATANWIREAICMIEQGSQAAEFQVRVAGTWTEPRFSINGVVPQWLTIAVETKAAQVADQRIAAIKPQIRKEFATHVEHMNLLSERASVEAEAIADNRLQKSELIQQALKDRLQEIAASTFARRPADVTTR